MSNETATNRAMESSEQELQRLIVWTKDHPKDWNRICSPESFNQDIGYIAELVERLYQEKLLTVIYFVLFTNHYLKGVNGAITTTIKECFLDIPVHVLMERFRKNLEFAAKEKAQKQQEEQRVN